MSTSRRNFIKSTFGLAAAGLLAPSLMGYHAESFAALSLIGISIVADGKAQAVIIIPDHPSHVAQYAAQELQWHVQQATGVTLDIIEESSPRSATQIPIYVGPGNAARQEGIDIANLPLNGYIKKVTNNAVYLVGKDDNGKPDEPATRSRAANWKGFIVGAPPLDDGVAMGTLFAVYDWLEHQIGVKWLWPGEDGTIVPALKVLLAKTIAEQKVIPTLIHSRPRLNVWRGMDAALKDQYIYDGSAWLRRQRFARAHSFEYGHAYTKYWERFGASHPEYFALRPDGVRAPHSSKRPDLVQMCVSNNGLPSHQGLHQQIIEDWLKQRQNTPSLPWINGAENDKTIYDPSCTCPHCRAWDPPNAPLILHQEDRKKAVGDTSDQPMVSLSDRYAKFWLALQKEGEKHDPNATVLGYAYADYTQPPVATQLNERIIVAIVAPNAFPMSEREETDFKNLWNGWAATGARLYWRPNFFLSGYCMPYIFAREFGKIYKYVASHNMIANDYDSLLSMWGVQSPNYYMMGRLNVDPTLDVDKVMDDYYAGFGPAANQVQKYFSHWESVTSKFTSTIRAKGGGWGFVSWGGDEIFTPDTFVIGKQLLQNAQNAARGDAKIAARIEYMDLWLQHADLCMKALAAYHEWRKNTGDISRKSTFDTAKINVDTFRKEHPRLIPNIGVLEQLELWAGWRKAAELEWLKS